MLRRGHACHFRLRAAGLHGLRIDVMSIAGRRACGGPRPPRPALRAAITGDQERAAALLKSEEDRERQQDRVYWVPLRTELEHWRA